MPERPPTVIAHPWHGVPLGDRAPDFVTCYIEIVPTDTVKYELDKLTGLLKVDRPQKFSNVAPSLYGFLPRTYCAEVVGKRCSDRTGKPGIIGDHDPLDVCVLSERVIAHGGLIVTARPIGGIRMLDGNEADDKIIAVLEDDAVWGGVDEVTQLPAALRRRFEHYFLTYKLDPRKQSSGVEIADVYGADEARAVIAASRVDYSHHFEVG